MADLCRAALSTSHFHAVGDQGGDAALHHARRTVAEDAGAGDAAMASTTAMAPDGMASIAVRVEIGDDHDLAWRSRRARVRSAKRERRPHQPRHTGLQGFGAAHPDISQTFEQNRGDGGGGYTDRSRSLRGRRHLESRSGRDELAGAILRGAVIASRVAIDLTDHQILSATC